jgi:hypothetical protein
MFRRKIHRVLSILVFIATVASPLLAQAPSMTGTVVDQTGAVLPSASVIKPNRAIRSRPCCDPRLPLSDRESPQRYRRNAATP